MFLFHQREVPGRVVPSIAVLPATAPTRVLGEYEFLIVFFDRNRREVTDCQQTGPVLVAAFSRRV